MSDILCIVTSCDYYEKEKWPQPCQKWPSISPKNCDIWQREFRQQIIFEHYQRVREKCYLNLRKDGYLECEKCECHGECFFTELYYCSDDQLKAFIEKVEGGE